MAHVPLRHRIHHIAMAPAHQLVAKALVGGEPVQRVLLRRSVGHVLEDNGAVSRQLTRHKLATGLLTLQKLRLAVGIRDKTQLVDAALPTGKRQQLIVLVKKRHVAVERKLDTLQQLKRQRLFFLIDQGAVVIGLVLVLIDQFNRGDQGLLLAGKGHARFQIGLDAREVGIQALVGMLHARAGGVQKALAQEHIKVHTQRQHHQHDGQRDQHGQPGSELAAHLPQQGKRHGQRQKIGLT